MRVNLAAGLVLAIVAVAAPAAAVDRYDIILGHPVAESGDRLSFETYELINRSGTAGSDSGNTPLITSEEEPVTVWLFGITAPSTATDQGKEAHAALSNQLGSRGDMQVRCAVHSIAPDGRPVAVCQSGLITYSRWMLVRGYAAACRQELEGHVDEKRYLELESSAIDERRELWRGLPEVDWRTNPGSVNQERCG